MVDVFRRVGCAVDGSLESVEAARQVARLAPRTARLLLLGAVSPVVAAGATVRAPQVREARMALDRARERIPELRRARVCLVDGPPIPTLLATLRAEATTLVAVGIHRRSRSGAIALGSVATAMLHDAPSSVYVGRGRFGVTRLPRRLVVGVDGSPGAQRALEEARRLAARIRAEVWALVALGGKPVDVLALEESLKAIRELEVIEDPRRPAKALAATDCDLLVLGSRGVHGLRALGSVSERVAHEATVPVLVVRAPNSAA